MHTELAFIYDFLRLSTHIRIAYLGNETHFYYIRNNFSRLFLYFMHWRSFSPSY